MHILTDKKVTTRKPHVCHGCIELYPPKTKMRYTTSVDGGIVVSAYWCQTCDEVIEKTYDYFDLQDGIGLGEVKDNDFSYWESVHAKYSIDERGDSNV